MLHSSHYLYSTDRPPRFIPHRGRFGSLTTAAKKGTNYFVPFNFCSGKAIKSNPNYALRFGKFGLLLLPGSSKLEQKDYIQPVEYRRNAPQFALLVFYRSSASLYPTPWALRLPHYRCQLREIRTLPLLAIHSFFHLPIRK